jgi:hypothetical protein
MSTLRFYRHILALILALTILTFLQYTIWRSAVAGFYFGWIGLLHGISLVAALRDRRDLTWTKIAAFLFLSGALSFATPWLGMWVGGMPIGFFRLVSAREPGNDGVLLIALVCGSIIGSAGYWLFVRLFWIRSLRLADALVTIALCGIATLIAGLAIETGIFDPVWIWWVLTVTWWFAFSLSLYFSRVEHLHKATQSREATS